MSTLYTDIKKKVIESEKKKSSYIHGIFNMDFIYVIHKKKVKNKKLQCVL